jgi:hypothetical protein
MSDKKGKFKGSFKAGTRMQCWQCHMVNNSMLERLQPEMNDIQY